MTEEEKFSPICPHCGSKMVLREARKGRNAGHKFYGCSRYPECKQTLDLREIKRDAEEDKLKGHTQDKELNRNSADFFGESEIKIPVVLKAREKFKGYQVKFYETLATSTEIVEGINYGKIKNSILEKYNQWRMDYPLVGAPDDENGRNEDRNIYIIAHKILTRGRITLCSPFIEDNLRKYFKIKDTPFLEDSNFNFYLSLVKTQQKTSIWFDGITGLEKKFYENSLFEIFGPYYKKFVLPQIYFSSIVSGNKSDETIDNQRADFLITADDKKAIVELDDESHSGHKNRDDERTKKIERAGYKVFRINNKEIEDNLGSNLQQLLDFFGNLKQNLPLVTQLSDYQKFLLAIKLIHQLEVSIVEAFLTGFLKWNKGNIDIYLDGNSINKLLNKRDLLKIVDIANKDIQSLFSNIAELYGKDIKTDALKISLLSTTTAKEGIIITYDENFSGNLPTFYLQDISFLGLLSRNERPSKFTIIENSTETNLKFFLKYIFRFDDFLEGQFEAISRALSGKDTIVLLPTGSGKSLAFQFASLILPGVTIVIDPLISLIDDQVDNLQKMGIDRVVGITSQIKNIETKYALIKSFGQGEYIFCYIAPERFQTEEFRKELRDLTMSTPISLIVIDETHCVSEWGHDFRTSYLNIGRVSRDYCKFENRIPPLLALTGTASNAVLRDVQRELQIDDFEAIITPKTFDRKELHFSVHESLSAEKFNLLKGLLQRVLPDKFGLTAQSFFQPRDKETYCGIIFCPHIKGNFGIVPISKSINNELGIPSQFYGGDLEGKFPNVSPPDGSNDWSTYKKKTAKLFKINKNPLLVATKSFGMGIDKPNVRYAIHYGIPDSIEAFYQEAGRAGRDRQVAECALLISNDHPNRTNRLLTPEISAEDITEILEKERDWDSDDDITRVIYLHARAFRGVKAELEYVDAVLKKIGDIARAEKINIVSSKTERQMIEKGVHRLLILGAISDYTIDYATNEFHIYKQGVIKDQILEKYAKYVRGYNKGRVKPEIEKLKMYFDQDLASFVKKAAEILIEFIYDTIEKGRRRALREMLTLAEAPSRPENFTKSADEIIRQRILRHLESVYSEEIEAILNSESSEWLFELQKLIDGYESETGEIIGGIKSPKDAAEIRGEVARYLESTPDHPSLLFLRALSETYCTDADLQIIIQNVNAAIEFARSRYNIDKNELYRILTWFCIKVYQHKKSLYQLIICNLLYLLSDSLFARSILFDEEVEEGMIYEPGVFLFKELSKEVVSLK